MTTPQEGRPAAADLDRAAPSPFLENDPEELYESAPCGYVSALPDGTIAKVNGTFLAWTGYERGALVGRARFADLLAPGDRIFYETHLVPMLQMQGQAREIAAEVVCRSGARLPVLLNAVLKRDAAGEPVMTRTVILDATERRAYERELLVARRRAEESEERATALARTLQATFLPPALPEIPGLDIGGGYRPSGDGSEVGGDFYDVFPTGRDTWAVAIGDVCGKGPSAAVITGLARHTLRTEALHSPSPSAALTGLHDALLRYYPNQFCTAVFGDLARRADGIRLTAASGGHHLPLCVRTDGRTETIGATGRLLGMLDRPHLADTSTRLAPGDVVVFFTDGVVEARRGDEFFGHERLEAVVVDHRAAPAQDLADRVVGGALEFQNGQAQDDIAVVVLKVLS